MDRSVKPEWLDELAVDDPRALRSRRDLVRLNALMRNGAIIARTLRSAFAEKPPKRVVEIGAGDGRLLLDVAQRLSPDWKGVKAILVDQLQSVPSETLQSFRTWGWEAVSIAADVFDWMDKPEIEAADALIANLFLHHFCERKLAALLSQVERRTRFFAALEPRRSHWALACSRLVSLIGCNEVTRHDAPISVQAGFLGAELSELWPKGERWSLQESSVGCFGHLLVARWKEDIARE